MIRHVLELEGGGNLADAAPPPEPEDRGKKKEGDRETANNTTGNGDGG